MPRAAKRAFDYIVHFIGYGGYVVGKRDDAGAILAVIDFSRDAVGIEYSMQGISDGIGHVITQAVEAGSAIQRGAYKPYLLSLHYDGPLPIEIYGVGLVKSGTLRMHRVRQAVDGRAFQHVRPSCLGAGNLLSTHRADNSLALWGSHFEGRRLIAWRPEIPLGPLCVAIEWSAVMETFKTGRHALRTPTTSWGRYRRTAA